MRKVAKVSEKIVILSVLFFLSISLIKLFPTLVFKDKDYKWTHEEFKSLEFALLLLMSTLGVSLLITLVSSDHPSYKKDSLKWIESFNCFQKLPKSIIFSASFMNSIKTARDVNAILEEVTLERFVNRTRCQFNFFTCSDDGDDDPIVLLGSPSSTGKMIYYPYFLDTIFWRYQNSRAELKTNEIKTFLDENISITDKQKFILVNRNEFNHYLRKLYKQYHLVEEKLNLSTAPQLHLD